ncbi:MAG: hypothetical protein JXQ73_29510, partial [Phycisphaerae bacterium]|nr:hypothetical protein [Phycisphaerae bacterium]
LDGYVINQLQLTDMNADGLVDCFLTASGNLVGMQRGADVYDYWLGFSIVATDPVADVGRCAFEDLNKDNLIDLIVPLDRDGLTQDQILILTRLTP